MVTSQAWCSTPSSSPTIVGMAVDTIVWSKVARNIAAMSAEKMRAIVFLFKTIGAFSAVCVAELMRFPPQKCLVVRRTVL